MSNKTNFAEILRELKKHYKPLAQIAKDLGLRVKTLQEASRNEHRTFYYDKGKEIMDLYQKYCIGDDSHEIEALKNKIAMLEIEVQKYQELKRKLGI